MGFFHIYFVFPLFSRGQDPMGYYILDFVSPNTVSFKGKCNIGVTLHHKLNY